jgi:hypothetical protein
MKKIILSIFLLMIISNASAENIFNINWNFGNMGLGVNYSSEKDDNIEFAVSILNLTFEQEDTNIGIEFNPVKYWYLFELQNEPEGKKDGSKFSFMSLLAASCEVSCERCGLHEARSVRKFSQWRFTTMRSKRCIHKSAPRGAVLNRLRIKNGAEHEKNYIVVHHCFCRGQRRGAFCRQCGDAVCPQRRDEH